MRWDVRVAEKARRAHRRAPKGDQTRIAAALEAMRADPVTGDVVHLKNESAAWRRRVGDWRILFDLYPDRHLIDVVDIRRRTTTAYRKR
jgi:mRNA interferase RelE/StbE